MFFWNAQELMNELSNILVPDRSDCALIPHHMVEVFLIEKEEKYE